jgi:hypothetical protein
MRSTCFRFKTILKLDFHIIADTGFVTSVTFSIPYAYLHLQRVDMWGDDEALDLATEALNKLFEPQITVNYIFEAIHLRSSLIRAF